MTQRLNYGDRVSWNTPQGRTSGRVAKRLTHTTYMRGHKVKATPGHPQYLVTSDRSGKKAAHKPSSLKKLN